MTDFLMEEIKCSVCLELSLDNLMQCYNGHSHCEDCYKRLPTPTFTLRKRCSVCTSCNGWTRQRIFPRLIDCLKIKIPCDNDGCGGEFSGDDFTWHQKTCKHRLYVCPLVHGECDMMHFEDLESHIRNHGRRVYYPLTPDNERIRSRQSCISCSNYLNIFRSNVPDSAGRIILSFSGSIFVLDIAPSDTRYKCMRRNPCIRLFGYGPPTSSNKQFQVEFDVPDLVGSGRSQSVCDVTFLQSLVALEDTNHTFRLHTFENQYTTSELVDRCWVSENKIKHSDLRTLGVGTDMGQEDEDSWSLFSFSVRFIHTVSVH